MSLPALQTVTEEDELVTCTQHGGFGRARKQAKAGESSEVEIRNCIENFCPVWQRTARSETTQDKARSSSPCQLSNLSQSVTKKKKYAVSIFQNSQDSCGHACLNKRDSVIAKLSTEVRRQVEISVEWVFTCKSFAFCKGETRSLRSWSWSWTQIQCKNLNKICINLGIHAPLIIESNHLFVDFSVYIY